MSLTLITPKRFSDARGWFSESFESGIASTIEWYLSNESWWRDILSGAYQGERLGLSA